MGQWPEELMPVGEGEDEKESFDLWWTRNENQLSNLHPQVAEQWVYRHWQNSPFFGIKLEQLTCKLERWDSKRILDHVLMLSGPDQLIPMHDYAAFNREYYDHQTSTALDKGTWDYPIVVLSTPEGVMYEKGEFPDERCVLIEGHQRLRYFNALFHLHGDRLHQDHELFILTESFDRK